MKQTIILSALLFLGITAAAASPASKLIKRLKKIERQGIMLGHQDDTMYGTTWSWTEHRSDVREITGDYPAIMGFDLGELELDHGKNLDKVPFYRLRREALAHYERGGLVTLSWHPHNPVTGNNAWDPAGEPVKKILKDGPVRDKFLSWLHRVSSFIKILKTDDGKQIPVIFRPWHEMNGGWFWWGKDSCTPEEYKQLYRLTRETIEADGLKGYIVWAWSPNLDSPQDTETKFMTCYPGDDIVDLLGIDIYEFDYSDANYTANLTAELKILTSCAKAHGKLAAITETGCRGIQKKATWFTSVLQPILKPYIGSLSYILFWRNDYIKPEQEAYLPGKDDESAPDFKTFTDSKEILMTKDIR